MINQFVQLQDDGINTFPKSCLIGIDPNDILLDQPSGWSGPNIDYTATEDCIVFGNFQYGDNGGTCRIDGTTVLNAGGYYDGWFTILLKKGQRITNGTFGTHHRAIRIFGLKYI